MITASHVRPGQRHMIELEEKRYRYPIASEENRNDSFRLPLTT